MKRFAFALALALVPAVNAQSIAITNARIHTVAGPVIERGTVVISNGKITAVGANVTVPTGARVIDAAGKVVAPGFLDSSTGLGTVEIDADDPSNDQSVTGDRITAAFNVADNLNPLSTLLPVTRVDRKSTRLNSSHS